MNYKSKQYKDLEARITGIQNSINGDQNIGSRLARISGQKGAEKRIKDKIGEALNRGDPAEVIEKLLKRLEKMRGDNDS